MTRVVMAGPLPPAIGGMATVIGDLSGSSLGSRVTLELFETGKTTPPGRSLLVGVRARLSLMARWWRVLGGPGRCIAHIHTCSGFTFFLDSALAVMAGLRGRPVVLHVHGARFDAFLDGLGPLGRTWAGYCARHADVVVVLSEEWRATLAHRWPEARLRVVPNGVAVPAPVRRDRDPSAPVAVAFLGNLGRRKGVPELLRAACALPAAVRLRLAGGEEEPGFAAHARQLCQELGVQDRVEIPGPVTGPAKQAFLAASDVFVLPSHAEGLPMALLEAMAASLPVVVTTVGAIPSVVRDGIEGLLVAPGDVQGLAQAIGRLAADAHLRQRMGEAARSRCLETYGLERTVALLLEIYAELDAGGGLAARGAAGEAR